MRLVVPALMSSMTKLVKHLCGAFVGIFTDFWQIISFFNINLFARGIVYFVTCLLHLPTFIFYKLSLFCPRFEYITFEGWAVVFVKDLREFIV